MQEPTPAPAYPFPWMPLEIGEVTLVGFDGFSYVDQLGRTYWAGAEPSPEDATAAIQNPAPRALDRRRSALRARAKQRRRETEEGGITLPSGAQIATDRESQGMLDGALTLASLSGLGSAFSTQWKCDNGVFVALSHQDLMDIALAVGLHVQACFAREAELAAAIDASTTAAELDALETEIEAFTLPPA